MTDTPTTATKETTARPAPLHTLAIGAQFLFERETWTIYAIEGDEVWALRPGDPPEAGRFTPMESTT